MAISTIDAGVNNAHVTLGNGNSTIAVSGTGAVITTGNGNNTIVKPTGRRPSPPGTAMS